MMAEKKIKLSSGHFIILGTPMQIYKTYSKPNLPYLLLNLFLYAFPSSFYYQLINISIKITTYSTYYKNRVPSHMIVAGDLLDTS